MFDMKPRADFIDWQVWLGIQGCWPLAMRFGPTKIESPMPAALAKTSRRFLASPSNPCRRRFRA
jgi:hypothetical protein